MTQTGWTATHNGWLIAKEAPGLWSARREVTEPIWFGDFATPESIKRYLDRQP